MLTYTAPFVWRRSVCHHFAGLQAEVRALCRAGKLRGPTCGMAPGYAQANLVVMPASYAKDFALYCARNPQACPLLVRVCFCVYVLAGCAAAGSLHTPQTLTPPPPPRSPAPVVNSPLPPWAPQPCVHLLRRGGFLQEQTRPGAVATRELTKGDVDLRRDLPGYNVYRHGVLTSAVTDIVDVWQVLPFPSLP